MRSVALTIILRHARLCDLLQGLRLVCLYPCACQGQPLCSFPYAPLVTHAQELSASASLTGLYVVQVQRPPNAPDAFRRAAEELVTAWFAAAAGVLLDPVQVSFQGLLSMTVALLQLLVLGCRLLSMTVALMQLLVMGCGLLSMTVALLQLLVLGCCYFTGPFARWAAAAALKVSLHIGLGPLQVPGAQLGSGALLAAPLRWQLSCCFSSAGVFRAGLAFGTILGTRTAVGMLLVTMA